MKHPSIITDILVGLAVLWIYDRFMSPSASASSSNNSTGIWT